MPSWDRPSGGSDKPPAPKAPADDPAPPVSLPQAGGRGHYERSGAGPDNRNAAEDTSPNGSGDRPRHPGDTSRETGSPSSEAGQYQALFDRQGQIIDTQKQRIGMLSDDVDKLEKRNEKLEDRIDKLQDRNAKLEARLEQRDQIIDGLRDENAQLRDKLADATAKGKGQSGEGRSEVDASPDTVPEEQDLASRAKDQPTPFYRKIPSKPVTDVIAKAGTAAATIAVATGALNGTAEKVAGGVAAVGLAYLEYRRQKNEKRKGEDDG